MPLTAPVAPPPASGEATKAVGFSEATPPVVERIRSTLAAIFQAVCGGLQKSHDATRLLGLDAKLSWQLFKLLGEGDALTLSMFIPTPTSFQRLLMALREHGVDQNLLTTAGAAYAAFEVVVSHYAGDRSTFDSMTRGHGAENDSTQDIRYRKMIYQGHRHFFGTFLDTYIATILVRASDKPGHIHQVHLRQKLGFHMLRPSMKPMVDQMKLANSAGLEEMHERSFFDPETAARLGAPIIPQFSTTPLPLLETQKHRDGRTVTRVVGDAICTPNAVEFVFGNIWRDVQLQRWGPEEKLGFGGSVLVPYPTTLLVCDILAHRDSLPIVGEWVTIYAHGSPLVETATLIESGTVLPYKERLKHLGRARKTMRVKSAPRYLELLGYCCDKLNWKLDEFDVYRLEIEFPILDAVPFVYLVMPEPSSEASYPTGR